MKKLLKDCLSLFNKKQKKIVIFLFLNSILISVLELIGIGVIPVFLSLIINPEIIMNTNLSFLNFNKIENLSQSNIILYGSILILVFFVFKNLYSIFSIFLQEKFFKKVRVNLVQNLLQVYLKKSYNFFINTNSTILIRNILNESIISISFITTLLNFFKELILTTFILVSLIFLEPKVVLSIIFLVSICLIIYFLLTKKKIKNMSLKAREFRGYQLKDLNHLFNSIKLVKIFNREKYFSDVFLKKFSESEKLRLIILFFTRFPRHVVEIFVVSMLLAVLIFMTYYSEKPFITIIPILTFFTMCALRLMPAINVITASLPTLRTSYTSLNFVLKDLQNTEKTLADFKTSSNPTDLSVNKGKKIDFQNVEFSYNEKQSIFEKISFNFSVGDTIAFMGESGTGKSTLIDLLMGLQKIKKGSISYNNINIFDDVRKWQRNFGYIPQNVSLIDESIKNNIAFGINEIDIDEEKIRNCIKLSQLEKLIDDSSEGIQTNIGERGSRISGGQIQRIGIARALYNNPKILIFDESTNSLDKATENKLLNDIFKLKDMYTIIIITHDISIAQRCNLIYQIKDKKVGIFKQS